MAALVAVALEPSLPASGNVGAAAPVEVKLPTARDAFLTDPSIGSILNGPQALETKLPGRMEDDERVRVALDVDGRPVEVEVVQRLVVHGLGDFSFKVPGPAIDVEALPGSQALPGLRRGAVLWQGFSPGRKELGARLRLYPDQEATRLPIAVDLSATVDGVPLRPDDRRSGAFELSLRVVDRTPVSIPVADADADPARVAPALDAIWHAMLDGARPEPGHEAVPRVVEALPPVGSRVEPVEAPMRVTVEIGLDPQALVDLETGGPGRLVSEGGRTSLVWTGVLGAGRPLERMFSLRGTATSAALPTIRITARTAMPSPSTVRPPGGESWIDDVEAGRATDGRAMLASALDVLWLVARLRQFDAYLGNPDPSGPATTSYVFVLDPPEEAAAPPPVPAGGVEPLGVAAVVLAALGLAWAGLWMWSRS